MKKVYLIIVLILFGIGVYFGYNVYPKLDLISGFSAKSVASGHFIDNRTMDYIEKNDNNIPMIDLAMNTIDSDSKSVFTSVYGLKKRQAIYREGLGATLINDNFNVSKPYLVPKRNKTINNLPFPYGDADAKDTIFSNIDYKSLNKTIDNFFDKGETTNQKTRSILVIYKDKIIAERYANGITKNSKILGWSMTKSVTATVFGILQSQKKYDIYKPAPISEWKNDTRKSITTNDLLHMNSGLEWVEDYGTICDATKMLFLSENMGRVQLEKPQSFAVNKNWNYSSGTSNLLSYILRKQFKTHQEYLDFWYTDLIDKIGMKSMLIETDMSGNYVGSSYGWATTRDWSKFGLLYLHRGNWNGMQIFDPSWADYVAKPTEGSKGIYGGHFWLNAGGRYPDAPRDLYSCNGYQGQVVFIIPSKNMVIVRMGLKEEKDGFDFNGLLKGIIRTVK